MEKADRLAAASTMSTRTYNLIMGLSVLWGLILDVAICLFAARPLIMWLALNPYGIWILILGFLVISIATTVVIHKTDKPTVSFIGYTILSAAVGILVATIIPFYTSESITEAFMLTTVITGAMVLGGFLYPELFLKMGRALFFGLIITLIAEVIFFFINPYDFMANVVFNVIFVVIFALYIAFDFARSQQYGRTLNNAIVCAADLYIDIINLFLRLLDLSSRR